ncbi:MAG TPA: biopolymer transporter ExbD, partial [Candidatus Babeliales bacterium]|nr:biopolymer transporter ExbD [Candidatus Babeliales bacterium]
HKSTIVEAAMQRSRRRNRRTLAALPEIGLTPLIDTALTLLIIFMVTSPMINNVIKVELPKGRANEDSGTKQELIVFVDKDAHIYLNDQKMNNLDELIKKIKAQVGNDANRTVFVKADQTVHYGNVIELVDHIKVVGGISYVALATKRA